MENVKLEVDLKLENIFVSITKDTLTKLNDIINTKEIDPFEKSLINKYIYITNTTGKTPNIELMKKEFPNLYFDNAEILGPDELDDYIRLYISNRKNAHISRQLLDIASVIRTNGVTEEVLNKLNTITKSDVVNISHSDIRDSILDLYKNKVRMNGILTGVKRVDNDTGGLQAGTLATILGFTGSFKTTWALNISYNAITAGKNVLYLSLEVTSENIYYNLLSRHSYDTKFKTHIEQSALKHKAVPEEDFKYLEETIYPDFKNISGRIYTVDETELESYSFYSLETKFREIDKLATEETGHGIDVLVVDHAQLLKFDASMKGIGNETNVVNAYVSFFRQSALNWVKSGRQILVLVLSQSSREGWKEAVRAEGRYRLTALAEANELERASSIVLSVFSSESLKQVNAAKVQLLKHRDGQAWSEPMEVFVDAAYSMFGDIQNNVDVTPQFNIDNISSLFDTSNTSLESLENLTDLDI